MIATKRPQWRFEKGEQHCILTVRQCDLSAGRVGEPAALTVELPAQKSKAAALAIALFALSWTALHHGFYAQPPQIVDTPVYQHYGSLIADGHPTREVARQLSYSERTVKSVLHDVTTRLQLRNRAHAVAFAVREGFI